MNLYKLLFYGAFCLCCLLRPSFAATAANAEEEAVVEALLTAQDAAHAGDAVRFEEIVNLNGILENGLDVFLAKISSPAGQASLPPMLALMLTGAAQQGAIRALLLDETRAFVLNGITSGSFAGKKTAGSAAQGRFAPLFSNASSGRKEILSWQKPFRECGGWVLPFSILDRGNGGVYDIQGYFEKQNGQWRLLAIRNMPELFDKISGEASE